MQRKAGLGLASHSTAYCQLICEGNRAKQLEWARENLGACFKKVIWSDETTFSCKKRGQRPRYKPRPKHPCKVHVWAGISWKGLMAAEFFIKRFLIPFIRCTYPSGHYFMQDNDPIHIPPCTRELKE